MKDLVQKASLSDQFFIESKATSTEEIWNGVGNPVYPPARRELEKHGLSCEGKAAVQMTKFDYERYDLLIGMDHSNLRDIRRICGGDPKGKIHLLMDYTAHPHDVADPWWTGDFETTWNDVEEGCRALLKWYQTNK